MKGLLPAILASVVTGLAAGASADGEPALGEREARIFLQACAHCHTRPGIGVPLVGDGDAWAERRARGFDVLVENTVIGFRGMPPLGTCSFCTEEELRRLVAFVAGYAEVPTPTGEGG